MSVDKWLAAALIIGGSHAATAAAAPCNGFLNQSERGFKLEDGRLEPSGPVVAQGTELEFNGIGKVGDKYYLTRARSDVIFDSANVELTSGCDLPTRDPAAPGRD